MKFESPLAKQQAGKQLRNRQPQTENENEEIKLRRRQEVLRLHLQLLQQ